MLSINQNQSGKNLLFKEVIKDKSLYYKRYSKGREDLNEVMPILEKWSKEKGVNLYITGGYGPAESDLGFKELRRHFNDRLEIYGSTDNFDKQDLKNAKHRQDVYRQEVFINKSTPNLILKKTFYLITRFLTEAWRPEEFFINANKL